MERKQILTAIVLVSILLFFLLGFLFLMLFLQRKKSNRFIRERENMKRLFNEQLLRAQLEIQEVSFNTVSMEIHDNVGQTLSLLKMQLNIIDGQKSIDRNLISEAKISVSKAMSDLRDIAKSLNTERIAMTALSEMVEHEVRRLNTTGLLNVSMKIENSEPDIDKEKKIILFRVIQECIQNIIKHADASEVKIEFIYSPSQLEIRIHDNGKGFDFTSVSASKDGLGLHNIFNRAAIIGGEAHIDSAIDKGTLITILSPYE
jgi:two-component system NarL family sensor kinase